MQFNAESSDNMLVLSLTGRLDFNTSDGFLREIEAAVVEAQGRAVILDCSGLDYVSSVGLRSFLIGARAANAVGIRFLVCGLQKMVLDVFEASGFAEIIANLPDRAAAEAAIDT